MRVARILLLILLLFNAAWISGFWLLNKAVMAPRVHADLMLHVTRIESLLGQPDPTAPKTLQSLETEFQAATADLQQLDGLLPLGGAWPVGTVPTQHHLLKLAIDTTQAAQNLISAVPLLSSLKAQVAQGVIDTAVAPTAGVTPARITLPAINRGQYFLDLARFYWSAAQQERQRLSPAAVDALHDPAASAFLAQYDHQAPRLSADLELASALLDWSPGALGVMAPSHILLLTLDPSDERSGGGRVWDYADLAISGGSLVGGIRFRSAQSLVCPAATCGTQPVPANYQWFPFTNGRFGLTDATLAPSLPAAVPVIEQTYQRATGTSVDGIIVALPGVFADLLGVTGPLTLADGHKTRVSAATVEALLTAEHERWAATGAPRAAGPDIETLLTRAILLRIAGANAALQERVAAALTTAIAHRDLSLYSNSPRVQAALAARGVTGDITTAVGDSLLVTDTNIGKAANNPLVTESALDHITLDAQGAATHDLTLTYTYNANAPWSGLRPLQPYRDFVRVMAPRGASQPQFAPPCVPVEQVEGGFISTGCQFTLQPGGSIQLRATWTTPAGTRSGQTSYRLLVQRQPGAHVAVTVSVVAPQGYVLARPLTSPDMRLSQAGSGEVAWTTSRLTQDALLGATLSAVSG